MRYLILLLSASLACLFMASTGSAQSATEQTAAGGPSQRFGEKGQTAISSDAALSVDHLSKGRFILGIGSGETENIVPYGFDFSKPVSRFEESSFLWILTNFDFGENLPSPIYDDDRYKASYFIKVWDAVFGLF